MQSENQQPYFFNPGMTTEQLEDWLNRQCVHVAHFNRVVREKAALERQLDEINREIELLGDSGFTEKQSFPWVPNPLLRIHPEDKQTHKGD